MMENRDGMVTGKEQFGTCDIKTFTGKEEIAEEAKWHNLHLLD